MACHTTSHAIRAVTEWPSPDQPLTLFIDSVDQLNDSNGGRRLDWLPVTGLPAHVRLVVSTLPDYSEFQCLSILRAKLADSAGSLDSHDSPTTSGVRPPRARVDGKETISRGARTRTRPGGR